jgi:hypothetical protein
MPVQAVVPRFRAVEKAADPKTGAEPPLCANFTPTRAGWPVHALIRDLTNIQPNEVSYQL